MSFKFDMKVRVEVYDPTGSINPQEARRAVRDTLNGHLVNCGHKFEEPKQVAMSVTVRPDRAAYPHDSLKLPEKPKLRLFTDPHRILFYVAADAPTAQQMHFERMKSTTLLVEVDLTMPGCH